MNILYFFRFDNQAICIFAIQFIPFPALHDLSQWSICNHLKRLKTN